MERRGDIGLAHFLALVCVELSTPFRSEVDGDAVSMTGYYITFAITALSGSDAKSFVGGAITDGTIVWSETEIEQRQFADFDPDIAKCCEDKRRQGIWYRSGHVYFPD